MSEGAENPIQHLPQGDAESAQTPTGFQFNTDIATRVFDQREADRSKLSGRSTLGEPKERYYERILQTVQKVQEESTMLAQEMKLKPEDVPSVMIALLAARGTPTLRR